MAIRDKTVLVTGANRGIGQALAAEALARQGVSLPPDSDLKWEINLRKEGHYGKVSEIYTGISR
jgi:hypothetical protein